LKELITKNLEVKDKFNYESHKTVESYENSFLSNTIVCLKFFTEKKVIIKEIITPKTNE